MHFNDFMVNINFKRALIVSNSLYIPCVIVLNADIYNNNKKKKIYIYIYTYIYIVDILYESEYLVRIGL